VGNWSSRIAGSGPGQTAYAHSLRWQTQHRGDLVAGEDRCLRRQPDRQPTGGSVVFRQHGARLHHEGRDSRVAQAQPDDTVCGSLRGLRVAGGVLATDERVVGERGVDLGCVRSDRVCHVDHCW
jgi:hypothetical protein